MYESNLPPGVTESMIPGNTPDDEAWDNLHETIDHDAGTHGLTDVDAFVAWSMGVKAYLAARSLNAKFPHDPPD